MMRACTLAALLTICGGALPSAALADPGGASAKRQVEVEPRFQIAGSHGYRLLISARAATVTIGVARGGNTQRAGSSTTYVARGVAGPNGIHANFHQFGRVEVRFHRTAEAARGLPPDCFGGTTGAATIPGYFTGTVDFQGQDRYTVARAHRVPGEVVLPPTEQCPLVAGGGNPLVEDPGAELPPAKTRMTLSALEKAGTGGLLFIARRAGKTSFYAERFDTVGRIGLLSLAYALGPRSSFVSDPQVSFGSIHPPRPFVGSATLRRGPGGKRFWTGTLAATFPGEEPVPLTGPEFHTTLSRSFPKPSAIRARRLGLRDPFDPSRNAEGAGSARAVAIRRESWLRRVLSGAHFGPSIVLANRGRESDVLRSPGLPARRLVAGQRRRNRRVKAIHALAGERGQGTVEYVGLILLVSLLMVGMVAAMKGFNGKQGTELADVIIDKIKEAVDKVAFK